MLPWRLECIWCKYGKGLQLGLSCNRGICEPTAPQYTHDTSSVPTNSGVCHYCGRVIEKEEND